MGRVLYIGGVGRSGTTVLERSLGELPGFVVLGEVVHLWQRGLVDDELCGCGEPFSVCHFWTSVGKEAFGGWSEVDPERLARLKQSVDRNRFIPRLAARPATAELREYVSYYDRVYDAAAKVSGADVVVDSSKHPSLAFCLARSGMVDLRVLHVVRDARGVAYSWTKDMARPEARTGAAGFFPTYSPSRTAVRWDAQNAAFGLLGVRAGDVRRVRYEDFVADPRAVLADVAGFAGAPVPAGGLGFATDTSVELHARHTVSGNPVRFQTGVVSLRRDEAWRSKLPAGRRRAVSVLAAPLLVRYGYPLAAK